VKVFLDSNVLFSICYSGKETSRSWLLYDLQAEGQLTLFISNLVQEEVRFNLKIKKEAALPIFEERLAHTVVLADAAPLSIFPSIASLPDNDRIILATALHHRMDVFLTGNSRDFSALYHHRIGTTTILTPRAFLERQAT